MRFNFRMFAHCPFDQMMSETDQPTTSQFILKLYVSGTTAKAQLAIANLQRICDEELAGKYELQVIDVLANPELAESDRILATPTLVKQLPPPLRRVIGDLSDKEKVLLGLEVRAALRPPTTPDAKA